MANHPNRSTVDRNAPRVPVGAFRLARERAGVTQARAAELLYVSVTAVEYWERLIEPRHITPGNFELFLLKTKQIKPGQSYVDYLQNVTK